MPRSPCFSQFSSKEISFLRFNKILYVISRFLIILIVIVVDDLLALLPDSALCACTVCAKVQLYSRVTEDGKNKIH